MTITYAVVTQVPPPSDMGNMATALGQIWVADPNDPVAELTSLDEQLTITGMLPATIGWRLAVFAAGEILILDGTGREVSGHGRKPSKWDISFETFETIQEAITRAREIDDALLEDLAIDRKEPSDA